jgi:hypothetical protein
MGSVTPFFRDRGFDVEATEALGRAYDIACRSLHPNGQEPAVQEFLAKKIIESAQYGERNPDRLAALALSKLSGFHRDVTKRFGLIPNFFRRYLSGFGTLPGRPISIVRSHRSSRNGCSSFCRVSAPRVIASFATAGSWSAMVIHQVTPRPHRKVSTRFLNSSEYLRRGGDSWNHSIKFWLKPRSRLIGLLQRRRWRKRFLFSLR